MLGFWFCLDGLLCLDQSGHEDVEVGWVDVADGDDAQVWVWCCVEGEACAGGVRTLLFLHVRSAPKGPRVAAAADLSALAFSVA